MDLVTTVLGAAPSGDQPLMEAGLDSLGAVDLRNSMTSVFGVELPPTATLDYPTVDALAKFIASSVVPPDSTAIVDPGYWSDDLAYADEAAAAPTHIIGLSCMYPGNVCSRSSFVRALSCSLPSWSGTFAMIIPVCLCLYRWAGLELTISTAAENCQELQCLKQCFWMIGVVATNKTMQMNAIS